MFRLLVLCAILTFVEPFRRHCHTHAPFHGNPCPGINTEDSQQDYSPEFSDEFQPYRTHCHTRPPFYGNPCPGITDDSNQESSNEDFKPYRRHCHTHPPFHGNPCPGINTEDSQQDYSPESSDESSDEFQPYRTHCHTRPPFYGNPCPGITDDSNQESSNEDFKPYRRHCHTHPPFHGNPCPGVVGTSEKPNVETQLQTIEKEMTEQEEKLNQFCKENSKTATELYGTENYFLQYDIPEASTVKVQIKHKFIHTTVTKTDGNNEIIFEDVKILPDIANSGAATWTLHNNKDLKITIPYKVPLGTIVLTSCGVVNNKVIDVPKVVYPLFVYRKASFV